MRKFVLALVLVSGCSSPGKIDVDGISGLVRSCLDRHDKYVVADRDMDPGRRESILVSSAIVRKILDEAERAKHPD